MPKNTPRTWARLSASPDARRDPLAVPGPLGGLLHEALHRADLRERLLRHRARLGDPVLHPGGDPPEPAPEDDGRADHDRRHQQRGQREPGLEPGEQHDAAHERQHLAGRTPRSGGSARSAAAPMSTVSRLVSSPVRRSAKKPGGISSRRREELAPEPGHRLLAGRAQQVGLDVVEHRLHGEQRHQAERDAVEQRAVAAHERGVEEVADDHREGEAGHAAQHQRDGRAEQPAYGRYGSDRRRPSSADAARSAAARRMRRGSLVHVRRRAAMAICSPGRPRMITLAGRLRVAPTAARGRCPSPRTAGRGRAGNSGTSATPTGVTDRSRRSRMQYHRSRAPSSAAATP